jgi:hypothetical protein
MKMSFNWKEFHSLAMELESSDWSAKKRTSINRSYYSAYCIARDFLIENQAYIDRYNKEIINSSKSKAHEEVKKTYGELYFYHRRGDKNTGKEISKSLDRLRKKRNVADYEKNFPNLEFEAKRCLIYSKYILDNVDKFL